MICDNENDKEQESWRSIDPQDFLVSNAPEYILISLQNNKVTYRKL